MKEFVEKLIERLEEEKKTAYNTYDCFRMKVDLGRVFGMEKAIEIVNQLAEEYKHCALCYLGSPCEYQNENAMMPNELLADKNGWIPCSEKLPPQPKSNLLFENKPLELYLATVKGSDYAWRVFWNGECFTDGWSKVDVLAWQPLPEPYIPKQEEQKG